MLKRPFCKSSKCSTSSGIAHRKKTSRHIEAIIHTTNQGERINMCAYDLEKASDTVEYGTCIFMNTFQRWHQRESQASWYHHPTTCVQANSCVPFEFGRYVQLSAVGESGYCQHVPLIPRAGHLVQSPRLESWSSFSNGSIRRRNSNSKTLSKHWGCEILASPYLSATSPTST